MLRNTKEKREYISEHIFWIVIAMIWYRAYLFRPIHGLTYRQSVFVLWSIIITFNLIGIIYSMKRGRNTHTLILNILISYGIYTFVTYMDVMKRQIIIACSIGFFLSISYAIFIFTRRVRNKRKYKKILEAKIRKSIECFRCNIGLAMLVIMLLGGFRYFQTGNFFSNIKTVDSYGEEYNLDHNIETIARFDERFWTDLDFKMKLEVAQTLANCEANYLGIAHEIKIQIKNLGENVLGNYDERTYTISIDFEHFQKGGYQVVNTICHEAFHAYEYELCSLYEKVGETDRNLRVFKNVNTYRSEISNYKNGIDDGFFEYYNQKMETDARNYAQNSVIEYQGRIQIYLENINE